MAMDLQNNETIQEVLYEARQKLATWSQPELSEEQREASAEQLRGI
jgi:hypothetical protein